MDSPPLPSWAPPATRALAHAAQAARVISACTPLGFRDELETLVGDWERGEVRAPRFTYQVPEPRDTVRRALEEMADALEGRGALGGLFAARAREIAVEVEICAAAGTPALRDVALRRFGVRDAFDQRADDLAAAWLDEAAPETPAAMVRSDDADDPRSLLRRLRDEVGALRLPVRVVVSRHLASLAAVGDGVVHVVAGRLLGERDVERTVRHEMLGHVLPRQRAERERLGLFAVGTAAGADDQEGRALCLEKQGGFLDAGRRRELALRHLAARGAQVGEGFVETARRLLAHDAPLPDALRIAARAHRGGGLAREAVYLPALLRVERALATQPSLDAVLARGRVAVGAASLLAPWVSSEDDAPLDEASAV
jgi:hypothetical protein